MSEVTLQAVPRGRDVVLEQIRIAGLNLRPVALVVAAVLAASTFMIGIEIIRGGPGFDSDDMLPLPLISFLFPFAVWWNDKRFGPAFLWTLPVERRRLALTKVLAGGVWLIVALAVFTAWLLALVLIGGASPAQNLARIPYVATIVTYLFGSAVVVGLRHPLRWILGTAGVLALMGRLSDLLHEPDDGEWEPVPLARAFFSTVQKAWATFETLPEPAQWAITTCFWLGLGLAALWLAASRHRERRLQ